MKIILPDDVRYIINTLTKNGYEAYAVGGCVRDSIICRKPGDWDITTSAKPLEVKALFRRTIDTGIKHGTVTVMCGNTGYEVTTYRVDGEYEDGRHPVSVEFTASLKEDLMRRDFTINAMAYNEETGIVDEFQGVKDIENGIIRCVGNPLDRFSEDALRMLRAVRFSAQLGYDIEVNTANAILKLAPTISKVSKERIHVEINKTLLSSHPEYIEKAYDYGICDIVFTAFSEVSDKATALTLVQKVEKDVALRYAALLYEVGANRVKKMLTEFKLDNATIKLATEIVKLHNMDISSEHTFIRKKASEIGHELLKRALVFEMQYNEVVGNKDKMRQIQNEINELQLIVERGDCLSIKDLAIDGNELIKLGVAPGKELGVKLKLCLEAVLEHPEYNNREKLIEIMEL